MVAHKIAIGLTSGNCLVHWVTLISAFQAMSRRDWSNYQFEMIPGRGIYVGYNRTVIAKHFLNNTDCDYLFYLDYDNGFYPEAFDLFMEDMEDPNVCIVSGAYYFKDFKKRVMVAGQKAAHRDIFLCDYYPEEAFARKGLYNITKDFSSAGGLVGAGCLMIKREVFEKLEMPYFDERWHHFKEDGKAEVKYFLGEDNYFCLKAQEAGFDIYLDTRIKSPHMKESACFPPEWGQYKEPAL